MYFKGLQNSHFGWDATSNGSLKTEQCDDVCGCPTGLGQSGPKAIIDSLLNGQVKKAPSFGSGRSIFAMESLILAQIERWRHGLGMQVERDAIFGWLTVAQG